MIDRPTDKRLHLVLGRPAKEALGAFEADDGSADVWTAPEYGKGDLLLTILDSRPRMFLCLETARLASASHRRSIEVEDVFPFPNLVPVAAVERRLGRSIPAAPGPVPDDVADRILTALQAEIDDPSPFVVKEGRRCHGVTRHRASGLQLSVLKDSGGVCAGCGRDHLQLFQGKGMAALEVHHLDSLSEQADEETFTSPERLVAVCGACHNLLHSSAQPSLQDLRYAWRPACPECEARTTQPILWGMPVGPVPDDVAAFGCDVPARLEDWHCATCGFVWLGEDEPGPQDYGYDFRVLLRQWPPPRSYVTYNFGSDRYVLNLDRRDDGLYDADYWHHDDDAEFAKNVCTGRTLRQVCNEARFAIERTLREEGKALDTWR